jgi:ribose transport system substrate-binding protein
MRVQKDERRRSRRARGSLAVGLAALLGFAAACGGSSSGGTAASPTGGSSSDSGGASAAVVAAAKAFEAKAQADQTTWTGPTTGPKALKGKKLAFISCGSFSPVCIAEGKLVAQVAAKIGWQTTQLDGQGTVAGWLSAYNHAISSKVNGIITYGVTPSAVPSAIKSANAAGIAIVAMGAESKSGPDPAPGVFYDATPNYCASGNAYAQYLIAQSNGTGRVVWVTDTTYEAATAKTNCFVETMKKCTTCQVLKVVNTPLATWVTDGPGMVTGWWHKYGPKPFYFGSVADFTFPPVIPALKAAGVTPKQMPMFGSDGSPTSYTAIRQGDSSFILATFPQPITEMAWLAVDGINRALSHQPAIDYTPPPYTVVTSNVDSQGGKDNVYVADYGFAKEISKIWGIS